MAASVRLRPQLGQPVSWGGVKDVNVLFGRRLDRTAWVHLHVDDFRLQQSVLSSGEARNKSKYVCVGVGERWLGWLAKRFGQRAKRGMWNRGMRCDMRDKSTTKGSDPVRELGMKRTRGKPLQNISLTRTEQNHARRRSE